MGFSLKPAEECEKIGGIMLILFIFSASATGISGKSEPGETLVLMVGSLGWRVISFQPMDTNIDGKMG